MSDPAKPEMKAEAARALLDLEFSPEDHLRMGELAAKGGEGTLEPHELDELESYRRVARQLDLLQAKALFYS